MPHGITISERFELLSGLAIDKQLLEIESDLTKAKRCGIESKQDALKNNRNWKHGNKR